MKIVFVHFGTRAPKHLILNILRCKKLFSHIPIVLITNRECALPNSIDLEIFFYAPSAEWHQLNRNLSHPKEFRENFWFTSLARFLALENYLTSNEGEIIHLESDVILSQDFPFKNFSSLKKPLAFLILSKNEGIASHLYIRNHESSKALANFSLKLSKEESRTTDMVMLKKFYDLNQNLVQALPTGPLPSHAYRESTSEIVIKDMRLGIDEFNGCFDGADIGIFLYGIDPRNERGKKVMRRSISSNFLNVREIKFKWSKARNFPNVISEFRGVEIPLYSIHVHSKKLALFRISKIHFGLKGGVDRFQLPESNVFVFSIFLQLAVATLWRSISRALLGNKRNER